MTPLVHPDLEGFTDLDRAIHEPVRLVIMAYLALADEVDFLFLQRELQVTQGNLGSHIAKLESVGYIQVEKEFVNKKPRTRFSLTQAGRVALREYRAQMKRLISLLPE